MLQLSFRDGETTIKIKFAIFRGEQRGKLPPKRCFFFSRGKRHDNKISKVQNLLLKTFVVIAQAPNLLA